jgi:hypothetical protein
MRLESAAATSIIEPAATKTDDRLNSDNSNEQIVGGASCATSRKLAKTVVISARFVRMDCTQEKQVSATVDGLGAKGRQDKQSGSELRRAEKRGSDYAESARSCVACLQQVS